MKNELINLITNKQAHVGVIGLGYVGLPLLVEFTSKGFKGTGFEVDETKVSHINSGTSYIGDVPSRKVKEVVDAKRLRATTDFSHLSECDAIIICVPTPLRKTKEPDVSYILAAAEQIAKHLRRGQLIILESTTYPGTTNEVLLPMFEEQSLFLEHREQHFVGRAGVSGRLENDQLTATQMLRDLFCGGKNVRNVWFLRFSKRRGNADDDRVAFAQMTEIGGGSQSVGVNHLLHFARGHVADVRGARVDMAYLRLVDFETRPLEPLRRKLDQQRQADVAEADDAHVGLFVCD